MLGLRHVPLAYASCGWFRRKARARTVPSPGQQETGDVPARVTVLPGQAGGSISYACGGSSKGTEGTAMLEIVHDLAPGAELLFATGIGGGGADGAEHRRPLRGRSRHHRR